MGQRRRRLEPPTPRRWFVTSRWVAVAAFAVAPAAGAQELVTALATVKVSTTTGEKPQSSSFYYRLLDARMGRRSTALATNMDFGAWADYLGDPLLATAFLDRLVDGAVILKLSGRSSRAHRARPVPGAGRAERN